MNLPSEGNSPTSSHDGHGGEDRRGSTNDGSPVHTDEGKSKTEDPVLSPPPREEESPDPFAGMDPFAPSSKVMNSPVHSTAGRATLTADPELDDDELSLAGAPSQSVRFNLDKEFVTPTSGSPGSPVHTRESKRQSTSDSMAEGNKFTSGTKCIKICQQVYL